ncbi:MAG TPA: anion permease [Methylomirabilota bacterium]|jgi:CRP-like cAMP-binding protein|nr:anion permease [Methylomirabilota bacterium]
MPNSGGLDSATALARSPLFSNLGRLDLARLAGELEEIHFNAGQAIVRQGDRPDGFYVIKHGRAAVLASAGPAAATDGTEGRLLSTLGPGEVFGEIALLTDSPRTATVVAETELTVWRLSRLRFDALLDHERGIARSIERSLSHRLTAMNLETGVLRALSHRLAAAAFGRIGPEAMRLVAGIAMRPRWTAETLRRICARTRDERALAELVEESGLLHLDGADLVLDPAVLALAGAKLPEPSPVWLRAAAEELASAGDVIAATDLALAAGAVEDAERLLGTHEARLLQTASARDLDRWLAVVGERSPALGSRLTALKTRLTERMTAPAAAAAPGSRERTAPLFGRLARGLTTVRALSAAASIAAFGLGWVLPVPAGLERGAVVALGAIVATVPLLVADVLPDYVVMLLLVLALVLPGLVPASDVLGGFAAPAWLMILTLLAVGVAVSRSGLMFRLVLLSLQHLPPRFVPQSLVLCLTGVLMSAGLTSGSTRIALGVPIARGITDAMGFAPRSPGAAAVGLMTFFTFLQVGELFQTGTFTGLVVHDLLPAAAKSQITWWRWFFIALPPFVLIGCMTYLSLIFLFKPHRDGRVNLDAVRLQQALLGPLTRHEIWSAVVLVGLIAGFASRPYHGIAPAWLALAAFLFLFIVGTLDQSAFQGGGTLGLLIYAGVILSLGQVFTTLHIDTWLTSLVQSGMPAMVRNPYGFVLTISILAFVLHFFVPWMTASTIIALVAMPIAEGLGFHPFVPVIVALIAGDHTAVPYVNSGYAIVYFASEGDLFTHAQARWPLVIESLLRPVALLLSVPVWQLMGLM